MNGFSMVERVRKMSGGTEATIMMLTSGGQNGDTRRCQDLGLAAYLFKPFKQSELSEAVRMTLARRGTGGEQHLITRHSLRASRTNAATLSPAVRRFRILLVEDNPVNQKVALKLLEKGGHEVVVTGAGGEALDLLEKVGPQSFDFVLMDVQMPGMDGFQATAAIRARERGSGNRLPVIALTAHAMKGDRERCVQAGMDGYVTKPIVLSELRREIEAVLPDLINQSR
jgi:CheY-like chemotaxis protein